jgi:hypothetical protein
MALKSVVSCSSVQPSKMTGSGAGESASAARLGAFDFFFGGIAVACGWELWCRGGGAAEEVELQKSWREGG